MLTTRNVPKKNPSQLAGIYYLEYFKNIYSTLKDIGNI